ncbi:MAG: DNA-binding protein [Sulfuriferula sp.]
MEKYVEIVETMLTKGEKVTLQSVRRVAGKGSFTTISEAIRLVLTRGLIPVEVTGPVPESLMDVTKGLWQEACKIASGVVASERLALHSARVASQESQRELTVLADALALQVDELAAQVESLQVEKIAAEQQAQEAVISLKAMQEMFQQLGLKSTKMEVKKGQTTNEA